MRTSLLLNVCPSSHVIPFFVGDDDDDDDDDDDAGAFRILSQCL
jgi:hypothetical protein